jgi:hypothetical protein
MRIYEFGLKQEQLNPRAEDRNKHPENLNTTGVSRKNRNRKDDRNGAENH